jgi:uncharacterized protein (UPF0335 family)
MSKVGHNSDSVDSEELKTIVERIERMNEEMANVKTDISEIYKEAKGNGFDVKTIRTVIKLRAMDREKREQQEAMLDLYMSAIGF